MRKKTSEVETKPENKQAVYRFIQTHGAATKQELSTALGLSLPTIKQSLEFLEGEALISGTDIIRGTGGRNATAYRIRPDGRFAVGVYLTSNHLAAVCTDLSGQIVKKKRIRILLNVHDEEYLKQIAQIAESVIEESDVDRNRFLGVGIAVPSLVSGDGENIIYGMTHDFSGITRAVLSRYIPYPTRMFHDSYVAGFAEVWNAADIQNAVYLSLNNSVGGSVIIDNRVYNGNNQRSGEIGHMVLFPRSKKRCYCGQTGCFDTFCNANVLDSHTGGNLEEFFVLVKNGDEKALEIWDTYLDHLALAIHNLRMLYDCEIILGGYVGACIEEFMEALYKKVDARNIFNCYSREYILPCKYKNESTAAGAAIQMIESFIHAL